MNWRLPLFALFLFISLVFLSIDATDNEQPHQVPETNLTHDEQLDELKEMSEELKQKIGPTEAPMVPAQNLSREEKMEQLLEMSEELSKKIEPTAVLSPEGNLTNTQKEEQAEVLTEEITRRLDAEQH
ncbi:hypothetical protein M3Y97_00159600 [Aphelenchoides bicaudatus]|nr:hypothetical protein M3Y97_00159600 [Aphelenchoides bicaudatus]